jgi:hypothetical protein
LALRAAKSSKLNAERESHADIQHLTTRKFTAVGCKDISLHRGNKVKKDVFFVFFVFSV